MKTYCMLCAATAVIMLLAPLLGMALTSAGGEDSQSEAESVREEAVSESEGEVSVFLSGEGVTESVDERDYLIGVLAAEMPASYHIEALKAQALAAATFIEYRKIASDESSAILGADVSDDPSVHQGYLSVGQMREKWGDAFDSYYEKLCLAVDAVEGMLITYEGEPIMAAYHAISPGTTESAQSVWGAHVPYLISVDSSFDEYSSRFSSSLELTREEFIETAGALGGADKNSKSLIEITRTTEQGTVLEASVLGVSVSGEELRSLFSLRSAFFTVEVTDESVAFSVKGYGHGVGMSQFGANCLAERGEDFRAITAHYYPGTRISES